MNYLNYDDCEEKNIEIISNHFQVEGLNAEKIQEILNNLNYKETMSKLLKYITDVSKMKPMTTEKVMKLSAKEFKYFPPNPQRATIPSVFVNVVFENISKVPKKDISVVLSLCAVLGKKFYDVPKSRDVFYSKIRKPILEKYGYGSPEYEKTLDLMKLTKDERTKLKTDYGKKIKKENKERKTYYSEDLINVIEET